MIEPVLKIIALYLILLGVILYHEIGHLPRKIQTRFPWPSADAIDARFRYGGLILNITAAILVFKYQPQNILFQAFGLFNFLHFVMYSFLGSIMPEPKNILPWTVQDDIPNKLAWLFIPIGILTLFLLGGYYATIGQNILAWVSL